MRAMVGQPRRRVRRMPKLLTILLMNKDSVPKLLRISVEHDGFRIISRRGRGSAPSLLRGGGRPRDPRHHAAEAGRARGLPATPPRATCRSSCSPRATTSSTRSWGSSSAPTTTSRSRSRFVSSGAVCGRCCGEPARHGVTAADAEPLVAGDVSSTRTGARPCRRTDARPHLRRVRAPADADRPPGKVWPPRPPAGDLGRPAYREPRTIDVHVHHLPRRSSGTRASPTSSSPSAARLPVAQAVSHSDGSAPGSPGPAAGRRSSPGVRVPDRRPVAREPASSTGGRPNLPMSPSASSSSCRTTTRPIGTSSRKASPRPRTPR